MVLPLHPGCQGCSEAGAWLDAIPKSRELTFSNAKFQTAVFLRLGLDDPILRQIQLCNCGVDCDARGYLSRHDMS